MDRSVDRHALPTDTDHAPLAFEPVYRAWFHAVERWLRAFGVADSEREDVTQEVFLVVERKLASFDGRNLPGWLFAIAARCASDHRRGAWFRRLLSRARDVDPDAMAAGGEGPEGAALARDERRRLHALLDRMSAERRTTLYLFEVEGYDGEEIAALTGVPVATVWTRLHRARKEFLALVARYERGGAR